jgi:uncharacterized protein YsxB (DUF464 family)
MTKITVARHKCNIVGFILDGHAGYGNEKTDIVCSGECSIFWGLVNTLIDLKVESELEDKYGYLSCFLVNDIEKLQYEKQIEIKTAMLYCYRALWTWATKWTEFIQIREVDLEI